MIDHVLDLLQLLSKWIDRLNTRVGTIISWAILAITLLSSGNAVARKVFNLGSNAALELQLYLFAAVFLLNSGNTLLRDEHIRIDVLFTRLAERTRLWIDIGGLLVFLLPVSVMTAWLTLPILARTYAGAETSSSVGGLLLWPMWLLVPVGFTLLIHQGLSELVKRMTRLRAIGRGEGVPA